MDRLELHVRKASPGQQRQTGPLFVQEEFEAAHAFDHRTRAGAARRPRYRAGFRRSSFECAGIPRDFSARRSPLRAIRCEFRGSGAARAETRSGFAQGRGSSPPHSSKPPERLGWGRRPPRRFRTAADRREKLGALNLRGKDCLFADVCVDKQRNIRKHGCKAVKTADGLVGLFQKLL